MGFENLHAYQFRNLNDLRLGLSSKRVFFVGENGQGKTNLVEAIYLLCYGSSFRTKRDDELPTTGTHTFSVSGLQRIGSSTDGIPSNVNVRVVERKKEIRIDDQIVHDRKELLSRVPCIVFAHDDMAYVSGPPENQRTFFNQTNSLADPLFVDTLRRYTKILRMRNSVLKEQHHDLLDVIDEQLVEAGVQIVAARHGVMDDFNNLFQRLFSSISGLSTGLRIAYNASWSTDSPIDELARRRRQDLLMKSTTSGPHRDRFRLDYDGVDFTTIASTGQIRLVSLIFKVAQAVFATQVTGKLPIVLLDDVLLELDPQRRARFMAAIPEYDQMICTFLPDEQYTPYIDADTIVYRVNDGRVEQNH